MRQKPGGSWMTCGCIPQVQSCLGWEVEEAATANSLFGCNLAEIVCSANTTARVKTTAEAAVTIVFMGYDAVRTWWRETSAHFHRWGGRAPCNGVQTLKGIR